MKSVEKIFDVVTGETVVIEHDLTPEQIEEQIKATEEAKKRAIEETKILEARKTILEKLGLTEEEAKVLLG